MLCIMTILTMQSDAKRGSIETYFIYLTFLKAFKLKSQKVKLTKVNSFAGVAQLVEHQPSKLRVVGSSLIARSKIRLLPIFGKLT